MYVFLQKINSNLSMLQFYLRKIDYLTGRIFKHLAGSFHFPRIVFF